MPVVPIRGSFYSINFEFCKTDKTLADFYELETTDMSSALLHRIRSFNNKVKKIKFYNNQTSGKTET